MFDAEPGSGGGANNTPPNPQPAGGKVFTEEYVSAIRNEAASYRTQLRSLEKTLEVVKIHYGLKPMEEVADWSGFLATHKATQENVVKEATARGHQLMLQADVKAQAETLVFN